MSHREIVISKISELLEEDGKAIPIYRDDLVLLESGLDSLGFAVLVTLLDEELGFDPFSESEEPIYPTTLREFVEIYDQFGSK